MASPELKQPELKQVEHELEMAAVHFSIAEKRLMHLSDADHAQSASVSEARVVSAAIDAMAGDAGVPLDQLLIESAQHPQFDGFDHREWRAFLSRVRAQLGPDRPADPTRKPPVASGRSEWQGRRPQVAVGALLLTTAVGLGALLLTDGSWISAGDDRCIGGDCSGGLDAIGADLAATTSTTPVPRALGTTQPDTAGSLPGDSEDNGAAPGRIESDQVSSSTPDPDATSPTSARSTSDGSQATTVEPGPNSTNADVRGTAAGPSANANSTTPSANASSTPAPTAATAVPTTTINTTIRVAPTTPISAATSSTTTPLASAGGVACPSGAASTQSLDVARVASDDVLNVRLGPSTGFDIVYGLGYNATDIEVFGSNTSGNWVMIGIPGSAAAEQPASGCGWVNSFYLTEPTP